MVSTIVLLNLSVAILVAKNGAVLHSSNMTSMDASMLGLTRVIPSPVRVCNFLYDTHIVRVVSDKMS